MTQRASLAKRGDRSAREALLRDFEVADNKTAFASQQGLPIHTFYTWREAQKKRQAVAGKSVRHDNLHGFLKAAEGNGANSVMDKLRADNDLLRELLRRAMQNGFLKDLLP